MAGEGCAGEGDVGVDEDGEGCDVEGEGGAGSDGEGDDGEGSDGEGDDGEGGDGEGNDGEREGGEREDGEGNDGELGKLLALGGGGIGGEIGLLQPTSKAIASALMPATATLADAPRLVFSGTDARIGSSLPSSRRWPPRPRRCGLCRLAPKGSR